MTATRSCTFLFTQSVASFRLEWLVTTNKEGTDSGTEMVPASGGKVLIMVMANGQKINFFD
jgi:mannose/fructose/N-acetylgalactosamine-specific phosphotransferase system component IIC